MKAATGELRKSIPAEIISIHAAREGGDKYLVNFWLCHGISIHAAREGGDPLLIFLPPVLLRISIHAAREGGDAEDAGSMYVGGISIHAAREGGDVVYCVCCRYCAIFQSTPPVKAATFDSASSSRRKRNFNPRRP